MNNVIFQNVLFLAELKKGPISNTFIARNVFMYQHQHVFVQFRNTKPFYAFLDVILEYSFFLESSILCTFIDKKTCNYNRSSY